MVLFSCLLFSELSEHLKSNDCYSGNWVSPSHALGRIALKMSAPGISAVENPSFPSQGALCVYFSHSVLLISWNKAVFNPGSLCLSNTHVTIYLDISWTWRSWTNMEIASSLTYLFGLGPWPNIHSISWHFYQVCPSQQIMALTN